MAEPALSKKYGYTQQFHKHSKCTIRWKTHFTRLDSHNLILEASLLRLMQNPIL